MTGARIPQGGTSAMTVSEVTVPGAGGATPGQAVAGTLPARGQSEVPGLAAPPRGRSDVSDCRSTPWTKP